MPTAVGVQWLSEESLARLEMAAKKLQFPEAEGDQDARLLWYAVSRAIPYLSNDVRTYMRQGLIQWARRLSQVYIAPVVSPYGSSPASKDAEVVLDVALTLSTHNDVEQHHVAVPGCDLSFIRRPRFFGRRMRYI